MEEKIEQFILVVAAELVNLQPWQWTTYFGEKAMLLTDNVTVQQKKNCFGEVVGLIYSHPSWARNVGVPALSHDIETAMVEMRGIMRVLLMGILQPKIDTLEFPRKEKKDLRIIIG